MLKLYKTLEDKALDNKTSGVETAKCYEVAANIAIDVLKMESEGIRAVKELGLAEKAAAAVAKKGNSNNTTNLNHLRSNGYDYDRASDNNNSHNQLEKEDDRKF